MFFDFSVEGAEVQGTSSHVCQVHEDSGTEHEKSSTKNKTLDLREDAGVYVSSAKEVTIKDWHRTLVTKLNTPPCQYIIPGSEMRLMYIDSSHIPEIADASDSFDSTSRLELKSLLQLSASCHSDLIPGVYEGGLKMWECTFDLVSFLSETSFNFSGKTVLELGCGAGLPAIFSFVSGAKCVHFHDYNSEVLDCITIPSLICNGGKFGTNQTIENRCRFYSGDWSQLPSILPSSKQCYDVILTSETIYCPTSQPRLLSALRVLSHVTTGVVFVAAKCVYFGVGGTVQGFCCLVEEEGTFDVSEVWRVGASVPRLILKLTHRKNMSRWPARPKDDD